MQEFPITMVSVVPFLTYIRDPTPGIKPLLNCN